MRNRRLVAPALVGLLTLATIVTLAVRNSEPRYKGKRLSEWLEQHAGSPEVLIVPADAQDAILHIGTNAIPTALRWISYETSDWVLHEPTSLHGALLAMLHKLTAPLKRNVTLANYRAVEARNIFAVLGPAAQPAIPQLKHLALTTSDELRIHHCLGAISCAGPKALPTLIEIINEGHGEARLYAIELTTKFGTNALTAVPILTACLHDTNDSVVAAASMSLGKIALSPSVVVPALAAVLDSSSPTRRISAAVALTGYGEAAAIAAPQLHHMATNAHSDSLSVQVAKETLQVIAPEALTNTPPQ